MRKLSKLFRHWFIWVAFHISYNLVDLRWKLPSLQYIQAFSRALCRQDIVKYLTAKFPP